MRTEQEMYDLILDYAKNDKRVRAVYMNGSRANPNAPKDKYMDFDIVYIVDDFDSFVSSPSWIDIFGERLILQTPETMRYPEGDGHFNWMMLFTDGNRIDLTLIPSNRTDLIDDDSATVVLLDKDNMLPNYSPASDKDYLIKKPDKLFYESCCNNFFWCMQNVAKGIARDELPYVMGMYHYIIDSELKDMMRWYIGVQTNFTISAGKMGKYFKRNLPKDLYEQFTKVYPNGDYDSIWESVFTACELFRTLAKEVGMKLGFKYNELDDQGIMTYLNMIKNDII